MKKILPLITLFLCLALTLTGGPDKPQVNQTIRAKAMANIVETVSSNFLKKSSDSASYQLDEPGFHLAVWQEKDAAGQNHTVFVVNCE